MKLTYLQLILNMIASLCIIVYHVKGFIKSVIKWKNRLIGK